MIDEANSQVITHQQYFNRYLQIIIFRCCKWHTPNRQLDDWEFVEIIVVCSGTMDEPTVVNDLGIPH